jgi:predicted nucleotidyltransferase component of viral defense system
MDRGFSGERAETVVLIREAAIIIFNAFPDEFVLIGGASLVLFHNSLRHSADLDLHSRTKQFPNVVDITTVLMEGLNPLAQLLHIYPLSANVVKATTELIKIEVLSNDGTTLFTVDLNRYGTVRAAGIEDRKLEAVSADIIATIKSVALNDLLLQKAETFLLRQFAKARDAYDIQLLIAEGATLNGALEEQVDATLSWEQMSSPDIQNRIALVDDKRCRVELEPKLPEEIYRPLEKAHFQPLRDVLTELFKRWI